MHCPSRHQSDVADPLILAANIAAAINPASNCTRADTESFPYHLFEQYSLVVDSYQPATGHDTSLNRKGFS